MSNRPLKRKRKAGDSTVAPFVPEELLENGIPGSPETTMLVDSLEYPIFVYGPYAKPGTNNSIEILYSGTSEPSVAVNISKRDRMFFKEHGVMILSIFVRESYGSTWLGHELVIVRDPTLNKCRIFDPNGGIHITYGSEDIKILAIREAVQKGLLLGLDPTEHFEVEFVDNDIDLQVKETKDQERAMQFENKPEPRYWPITDILRYDPDGFCVTWSTFRMIDYLLTGGTIYKWLQNDHDSENIDLDVVDLFDARGSVEDEFSSQEEIENRLVPPVSPEEVAEFNKCARLPLLIRLIAMHLIDIGLFLQECANNGELVTDLASIESFQRSRASLFDEKPMLKIKRFWSGMIEDPSTILTCIAKQQVLSDALYDVSGGSGTGLDALESQDVLHLIEDRTPALGSMFFPRFPFKYKMGDMYEPETRTYFVDDAVGYVPSSAPIPVYHQAKDGFLERVKTLYSRFIRG
tara:strand:+ start:166 stop:1557 length:1392 start_codon:yes stop_codon:yes gene_type:complete